MSEPIVYGDYRLYQFTDKAAYHVFRDGEHVGNIPYGLTSCDPAGALAFDLSHMAPPPRTLTEEEAAEGCNWEPGDRLPIEVRA